MASKALRSAAWAIFSAAFIVSRFLSLPAIRYKKNLPEMEYVERELYECAEISAQLHGEETHHD